MNCSKVQALLSAYLDREVSGHEMMAIRDHLRQCTCCREEEEAMRTVKSLLCCAPIEEPAPGFEDRLCAAVRSTYASSYSEDSQGQASLRNRKGLSKIFALGSFGRLAQLSASRPIYAYATVGLTAFAVALGALFVVPGHRSGKSIQAPGLAGVGGDTALTHATEPGIASVLPFGGASMFDASRKVVDRYNESNSKAAGKRFLELLDRDHAYISSADPLSGPEVALSASYVSR